MILKSHPMSRLHNDLPTKIYINNIYPECDTIAVDVVVQFIDI